MVNVAIATVVALFSTADAVANEFRIEPVADMLEQRQGHSATLLDDGRVLVAGGSPWFWTSQTSSAEIFDPSTGRFDWTGRMKLPRSAHGALRLRDGRVLVVGGWVRSYVVATETAETYEPRSGTFRLLDSRMSEERGQKPVLVELESGAVLVLGGQTGGFGRPLGLVERFTPGGDTFTTVAELVHPRRNFAHCLVSDGLLTVAGGDYDCCNRYADAARATTAEQIDLRSGRVSTTTMAWRSGSVGPSVRRSDGCLAFTHDSHVVRLGGGRAGQPAALAREVGAHRAVVLADGSVLVSGEGLWQYLPESDAFQRLPDTTPPIRAAELALLPSGCVLALGGAGDSPHSPHGSRRVWQVCRIVGGAGGSKAKGGARP